MDRPFVGSVQGDAVTVDIDVAITVDTKWAIAWVRVMCALRYVVGDDRAGRWAVWGAYRFARVRVGGRRLRR